MVTNATMPANTYARITPSDTANLPREARAIWVGTGGNLKVTRVFGATETFVNIPDGFVMPIQAVKVWATGTTATNLVALY